MALATQESADIYNIEHWSQGYFCINSQGKLCVQGQDTTHTAIELDRIIDHLKQRGLALPLLLRFTDILQSRFLQLTNSFQQAIDQHHYTGSYTAVYPIKVNQQRSVVETLISNKQHFGLEAGSKPELMAVLALANQQGFTIICNGYKDAEYIRLALLAIKLGLDCYLIIEKLSEIPLIIEESKKLGITPLLGMRARLNSIAAGNWQNTGGEKSKFGLSSQQIFLGIQQLRQANLLHTVKLLHVHMGSQISNIRHIRQGLKECARIYQSLLELEVPLTTVDVGGGLGIDYEGSRSRSFCSINYTLDEYSHAVVTAFAKISAETQRPAPHLITEAGRAMVAHHAVLIMPITEIEQPLTPTLSQETQQQINLIPLLAELYQGVQQIGQRPLLESYHELCHGYEEAHTAFLHGSLSLKQKALAENLYLQGMQHLRTQLNTAKRPQREIYETLNQKLAQKIFCNFSLFQSLPDIWAIQQIFPIMPLCKLNTPITEHGIIQDITCDSDGRIDEYIDGDSIEKTLPLPRLEAGDCLGVFLVGAYQEILGDMHNLFGDTHAVNVSLSPADNSADFSIDEIEYGDCNQELLSYVHYQPEQLMHAYQQKLASLSISQEEKQRYLTQLENSLKAYSYLAASTTSLPT